MEDKKVIHLGVTGVLLIIAIIAMALEGMVIWKVNKEKEDKVQEATSLQQTINSLNSKVNDLQGKIDKISVIINSNEDSNNEITDNQNVPEIVSKGFNDKMNVMSYFDENTSLEINDSYDIDGDGSKEYIYITNYYGENNIHIFDSNGNYIDTGIADGGSIQTFEIREKDGEKIIYVVSFMADGLCYQAEYNYALELKNGVFEKKDLANFSCDQEEEMKIRSALEHKDGSSLTEDEEKQYYNAHTLMYESNGKRISKSEFENLINEFKDEYQLVKKIK